MNFNEENKTPQEWIDEYKRLQSIYEDYLRIVMGDALINSQYVEKVFKFICILIKPIGINIELEDLLSGDPKRTRYTLGKLKDGMKNTNLFTEDFGKRLDEYVCRRNRLVHGYFTEHFQSREDIRVGSSKGEEYADYCGWLIVEGAKLIEVGLGIYSVLGLNYKIEEVSDPEHLRILKDFEQFKELGFSVVKRARIESET